jgi:hypothetical protein
MKGVNAKSMKKLINDKKYTIGGDYLKPKKNFCYKYKDGKYYVYYGKFDETKTDLPEGLYNKNGKVYLHKVDKKNLIMTQEELMADILKNKEILKENYENVKDNLTEAEKKKIFSPPVRESNDILVRLVKNKLAERKLPEKLLSIRFETYNEWTNFKRSLTLRDDMTIKCFRRWMDILEVEWNITLKDKE